jgi:KUP system potassium uptake protein
LLNYFGQSAFVMTYEGSVVPEAIRPFYGLMPEWFLIYGIAIATVSAVIASQALITGCFTLVNEAMKLRLWINLKVTILLFQKDKLYSCYKLVSFFRVFSCGFNISKSAIWKLRMAWQLH